MRNLPSHCKFGNNEQNSECNQQKLFEIHNYNYFQTTVGTDCMLSQQVVQKKRKKETFKCLFAQQ